METNPNFEPSPEKMITEDDGIEVLVGLGIGSSEAKKILLTYILHNEPKGENPAHTAQTNTRWAIHLALLYKKAGYKDQALEELEQSLQDAQFQGDDDLYYEILDLIEQIRFKE